MLNGVMLYHSALEIRASFTDSVQLLSRFARVNKIRDLGFACVFVILLLRIQRQLREKIVISGISLYRVRYIGFLFDTCNGKFGRAEECSSLNRGLRQYTGVRVDCHNQRWLFSTIPINAGDGSYTCRFNLEVLTQLFSTFQFFNPIFFSFFFFLHRIRVLNTTGTNIHEFDDSLSIVGCCKCTYFDLFWLTRSH